MSTQAILSSSAAENNSGASELARDHARRTFVALQGFRVYGPRWFRPWMTYAFAPAASRISPASVARFKDFNARLGACDLYTFANVFADYPVDKIKPALSDIELIVDLGANVGAFSLLAHKLAPHARIVAVEPDAENISFLRAQPFAKHLEIRHAAVGPFTGNARLVRGENSVTHHVDLSESGEGEIVPLVSLDSLCHRPALVKMDIEGGELEILRAGLPENVRHLALEWHGRGVPSDFVPGNWQKISTDLHGATMWWFSR
jgi:FkbM family methyltransferase